MTGLNDAVHDSRPTFQTFTSFSSEYQSDALTIIKPLEPLAEERKTRYISSIA